MKDTGVYKIVNTVNNKIYIGSTSSSFSKRKYMHFWKLSNNTHENSYLQRAYNKYGKENFKFEIIEKCKPEECINKEQYWIDNFNASKLGYNLKPIAGSSYGYKFTEIQKQRIRLGSSTRKPVYQINYKGVIINKYNSIKEASKKTGIQSKCISGCCNNEYKNSGGYFWTFVEEFKTDVDYSFSCKTANIRSYKIEQRDLNNKLLKIWGSIKEIEQTLDIPYNTIKQCLSGYNKTSNGFKWIKIINV